MRVEDVSCRPPQRSRGMHRGVRRAGYYTADPRRPVSKLMADPIKKTTNKIQAI